MNIRSTLIVGLALATFSGPAIAQQDAKADSVTQSATVQYDDLDLTTDEGQKLLDERIKAAANAICMTDRTGSRIVSREERQCIRETTRAVRQQISSAIARTGQEQALL